MFIGFYTILQVLLYCLICLNNLFQCARRWYRKRGLTGRRKSADQCQCNMLDKRWHSHKKSKEIFYQFYNPTDKVTHWGPRHYQSICKEICFLLVFLSCLCFCSYPKNISMYQDLSVQRTSALHVHPKQIRSCFSAKDN